jgi:NAD(P)-dependent dehydrogenase (short-subunit alcohol dehydrogenase family)
LSRLAVVTGAANGIGRAIAERMVAEGTYVVGVDLDAAPGAAYEVLRQDLSDLGALPGLIAAVESTYGDIDILVNVAGIYLKVRAESFDQVSWDRVLAVNLAAPVILASLVCRGMAARRWGRIVNLTSIHGEFGEVGGLAYDSAKAALNQATRTLAIELGDRGVLVNAVAPGFIDTRMAMVDGVLESSTEAFRRVYVEGGRIPLRRAGTASEVAGIVNWLCSADNTYVTGQVIRVDGGLTNTF